MKNINGRNTGIIYNDSYISGYNFKSMTIFTYDGKVKIISKPLSYPSFYIMIHILTFFTKLHWELFLTFYIQILYSHHFYHSFFLLQRSSCPLDSLLNLSPFIQLQWLHICMETQEYQHSLTYAVYIIILFNIYLCVYMLMHEHLITWD